MVFRAVTLLDVGSDTGNGVVTQIKAVRSHVRDVSSLVQALCKRHRLAYAKAQFSTRLLLQCRGCKRCSGTALSWAHFNTFYLVRSANTSLEERFCFFLRLKIGTYICLEADFSITENTADFIA